MAFPETPDNNDWSKWGDDWGNPAPNENWASSEDQGTKPDSDWIQPLIEIATPILDEWAKVDERPNL